MLDARVWLLWVLTTLVAASSARNPLYAVLLALVTTVVGTVCAPADGHAGGRRVALSPLRFAAIAVPLSALFNALTVHVDDTVLLRLPGWLPLLGGPITLEALVFGVQNGLVLTVIFAGFAVLNQVTPVRDLVGLAPRAFHEVGVVISIALTFVPQTIRSLNRIRQAQAVRGHRVWGLRDWPPIVVPLLISGLERSMGLAEAMVARGYGSISDRAQPLRTSGGLVLGLLTLLGLLAPAVGGPPSVPPASRGEETTDLVDLGAALSPPREQGGGDDRSGGPGCGSQSPPRAGGRRRPIWWTWVRLSVPPASRGGGGDRSGGPGCGSQSPREQGGRSGEAASSPADRR